MQRLLAIDFDGVLHSYTSGWMGAKNIPDAPVLGSIRWLGTLIPYPGAPRACFRIAIFSSRSHHWGGKKAIRAWLIRQGLPPSKVAQIAFPLWKPAAFLFVDDRAFGFVGRFPSISEMLAFKPWNRR